MLPKKIQACGSPDYKLQLVWNTHNFIIHEWSCLLVNKGVLLGVEDSSMLTGNLDKGVTHGTMVAVGNVVACEVVFE